MTLLELLRLLKKHLVLVIVLPVLCAGATAAYAYMFMPNQYTSSIQLYVITKANTSGSTVSSSDTTASQQLANDIAVLAKTDSVKSATARNLGLSSLSGYKLDVSSATTNRVITLSVTASSAADAKRVADELGAQTAERSVEVMGLEACNFVDQASMPTAPSGPRRLMYTAVAFLAGLFVAVAIVILMDMLDTSVKTREEAEELFGLPILGTMPELKEGK